MWCQVVSDYAKSEGELQEAFDLGQRRMVKYLVLPNHCVHDPAFVLDVLLYSHFNCLLLVKQWRRPSNICTSAPQTPLVMPTKLRSKLLSTKCGAEGSSALTYVCMSRSYALHIGLTYDDIDQIRAVLCSKAQLLLKDEKAAISRYLSLCL